MEIKHENVCCKCLSQEGVHTYVIKNRGYGSKFDMEEMKLQLCDDCNREEFEEYFNEIPIIKDYCENYIHEEKILEFINELN